MRQGILLRYTCYLVVMTAGVKVIMLVSTCSSRLSSWHALTLMASLWRRHRILTDFTWPVVKSTMMSIHAKQWGNIVYGLQAGRYGNALRAFDGIKAAGMQPNVVTYCSIISALTRSRHPGFVKTAHRLWKELQRSGQHLDAAAYRTGQSAQRCMFCIRHSVPRNSCAAHLMIGVTC